MTPPRQARGSESRGSGRTLELPSQPCGASALEVAFSGEGGWMVGWLGGDVGVEMVMFFFFWVFRVTVFFLSTTIMGVRW